MPGTETATRLPATTIWAVSEQRLFVFDATVRKRRRSVGPPAIVIHIAGTNVGASVEPFDARDLLLTVQIDENPTMVIMDPSDARGILAAIERVTVTDGDIAAPDRVDVAVAAPVANDDAPDVDAADRIHVDPAAGDSTIETIRRDLIAGDGEKARDRFVALGSAAEREWVLAHLDGAELHRGIDAWVAAAPEEAAGYLVRGANTVWDAHASREMIGDEAFWEELRAAETDLWFAVEVDFADPVPFTPLIRSGAGLQIPLEELCMRHDQAIGRDPTLLGVQLESLVALGPLGAGSVSTMLAFAASLATSATEGSPQHLVGVLARLIESDHEGPQQRRRRTLSATAIADLDLAVAMSTDSPRWDPGPAEPEIMNILAAAHARGGAIDAARRDLERVGNVRTHRPWALLSDGDALFAKIHGR